MNINLAFMLGLCYSNGESGMCVSEEKEFDERWYFFFMFRRIPNNRDRFFLQGGMLSDEKAANYQAN